MEQSEEYTKVISLIADLKQQLQVCGNSTQECEKAAKEASKEIEEHFAQCMNILAARKDTLLKEVDQSVLAQRKSVQETQDKLQTSIAAYEQTLAASRMLFSVNKSTAETMLKGILAIPALPFSPIQIKPELPTSIFDTVNRHGLVVQQRTRQKEYTQAAKETLAYVSSDGSWGLCFNPLDNHLYICERRQRSIKKISLNGEIKPFVTSAAIEDLASIVASTYDNSFYATDYKKHIIFKITATGVVSPFAGSGRVGKQDGMGVSATFDSPMGIAVNQRTGVLYVSDFGNSVIRTISPQGLVGTLAGSKRGFADGSYQSAMFNAPWGIHFAEFYNGLLVCDFENDKLRLIHMSGDVHTLCYIPYPIYVAVISKNIILVTSSKDVIYKVSLRGTSYITEIISCEAQPNKALQVLTPRGIAVHEVAQTCFVSELHSGSVQKISFV